MTLRRTLAGMVLGMALMVPALAMEPAIVYLTRHAEKAGGADKDPVLTVAGQARARQLAALLRTAGIGQIFTTPTLRTQQTAAPLASALGVVVQEYDAAQPGKLVERVKAGKLTTLVVGHSNTVPELVRLFGGKPGTEIGDLEYDRLYQLIISADGAVTTVLLHSS